MPEVERHFSLDENILPSTSKKCSGNDDLLKYMQLGLSEETLAQKPECSGTTSEDENFLNVFEHYESEPESSTSAEAKVKRLKMPNKTEKKTRCNECKKALDDLYVGCLKCQRFYLCNGCAGAERHQNHPLIYHKYPLKDDDSNIHMLLGLQSFRKTCRFARLTGSGFYCDGCRKNVDSERYYSLDIENYDLCQECLVRQDPEAWKGSRAFVKILPMSNDRGMAYEFNRLLEFARKKFIRNQGFINKIKLENIKDIDLAKRKIQHLEFEVETLIKCLKIEVNRVVELESHSNDLPEHRDPEKPKDPAPIAEEPIDESKKTRTLEELGLPDRYDDVNDEVDPEPSYEDQIWEEILIINNERKRMLYLENQLNLYKAKYGDL